ncbi:glycoside hydrolase family 47 protein [Mycena rebaudengoi]|nr:glycoside hydrolase family 47 protein [Mycena rebaudengoi]
MRLTCSFVVLALNPGLKLPKSARAHRDAAEKLFVTSYEAYKKYAFTHDNLSPVSKGFSDGRNGWGASIVDAMKIMGLDAFFNEAVNFSSHIDFSKSHTGDTVSVFETTIRYLGGLVSAYELGGYKHPALIKKAKELADKMAFAWEGDNEVPFGFLDFSTNTPQRGGSNIAEAGTLALEWYMTSKYTKNATYGELAVGSLKHIANLPSPLPGLAAQGIDPASGNFNGGYVSWGGGSDSYFEYLIKYARLSNTDDPTFVSAWKTAVDSSITTLLRRSTVGNHLYIADYDSQKRIRHVGSHLACFHAGNWLLGGKLLRNQTIVNIALELNEGCWNTYTSTATGIGPEAFAYISDDGNFTGDGNTISAEQQAFYDKHGFYLTSPQYILRPEVLESNFHAWRVTGNEKYLDRAASAIKAFNKFLPTTSFWFAEVLKYLYLTFDDPAHISLDEWVFNTEAQPFRAPPARASYDGHWIPHKPFTVQSGDLPEISPNARQPESLKKIINPD